MDINQISQKFNNIISGPAKSTTGILGVDSISDGNSNFENLLNQIMNNSQNPTLNNDGTNSSSISSIEGKDNIVNGVDNLSLQSQRAEQLQQMVMQQMMQIMTTQDASSSSSIGTVESEDSSDSLFQNTKSNNSLSQLIKNIVQEQANTSATNNNSGQINAVLSNGNL